MCAGANVHWSQHRLSLIDDLGHYRLALSCARGHCRHVGLVL